MEKEKDWLGKEAACALLGVARRTLERHEAQGYIQKRTAPRGPLQRNREVEYYRPDLIALKAGAPNVHARPVAESAANPEPAAAGVATMPKTTALAVVRPDPRADPFAALVAHLTKLSAAYPSPAPRVKPWLNPTEAAEYSGLPVAWILSQAKAGHLRAVNVGTGAREYWRIAREALEG